MKDDFDAAPPADPFIYTIVAWMFVVSLLIGFVVVQW